MALRCVGHGNYPLSIKSPVTAGRVYLNLAPGVVTVTDVLARWSAPFPSRPRR